MLDQFSKNYRTFYLKIVTKLSKYVFGIRDPGKTYPGSRGQKGTGSRVRIRNTGKNFAFLGQAVPHGEGGELPGPCTRLGPHSSGQGPLLQDPVHHSLSLSALFFGGLSALFLVAKRSLFGRYAPPLYFTRFYLETFSIMRRL
jgi:hypothetical protein